MPPRPEIIPVDYGAYLLHIPLPGAQVHQEAKNLLAEIIAAGINPIGLRFTDFIPAVLKRRMEELIIAARITRLEHGLSHVERYDDLGEDDDACIYFHFSSRKQALKFKSALL